MYMLNMVIILIVMYCNVVTAIDKIPMYLLRFNTVNLLISKRRVSVQVDTMTRLNTEQSPIISQKIKGDSLSQSGRH